MKHYLVSYSHPRGFGNIFFKASKYLDIRSAEKTIKERAGLDDIVIITINEIKKEQYVAPKEIQRSKITQ